MLFNWDNTESSKGMIYTHTGYLFLLLPDHHTHIVFFFYNFLVRYCCPCIGFLCITISSTGALISPLRLTNRTILLKLVLTCKLLWQRVFIIIKQNFRHRFYSLYSSSLCWAHPDKVYTRQFEVCLFFKFKTLLNCFYPQTHCCKLH